MKTQEPLFPFEHREILQTAMPLGGIGAGCICLNGYGGLQDFSIRNRPATTALPDGHSPSDTGFAVLRVNGSKPVTRLLEGPLPAEKIYDQGLQAQGYRHGGHEGLPRFKRSRFSSGYPFGRVDLSDPSIPVAVQITAWSPLVPLDETASSLPCAILEYALHNTSRKPVECEFSYHLSHLAAGETASMKGTRNEIIPGRGVCFSNTEPDGAESFGSGSLTVIGHRPRIKAMWMRGGWFDWISALWREVETGRFAANDGKADAGKEGRNGGSVLVKAVLAPGATTTIPVLVTWHFPNSNQYQGLEVPACEGGDCCSRPKWRTFYSSLWKNAAEVAGYVHQHYGKLRERTVAFQNALLGSSLPPAVLDAVSANLAILKSPTILRQENGNLWGWEGCFTTAGCCHGSCTHVWNYAQAFPHLFPGIERTLREQELERSMDEEGHVNFRAALPDGPTGHGYHAAADGQLGGIMKLYRDWQISGDTAWLGKLYPPARRSLEFCIRKWDPDREGALSEPHHNTYDIEFWGPDGMCSTVYIGALSAMGAMAEALGEKKDQQAYQELAERGARLIEKELFNGEYFEQKVKYRGLRDTSFVDLIEGRKPGGESGAMLRLLKKEGPKYQYGKGCLSDGVIGAWMARIYGVVTPLNQEMVRKNLLSIHRYNFRHSLTDHANCQRAGYAMGDEPGLLLCSWPHGGKPTLPFVYSDEVWTGIEYQVASHLIAEGLVREGIEIVKALRSRHTGAVRNPWNEYECGSYYVRAMASFALLGALSGFRYSAVDQTLWFGPKLKRRPFSTFFSTATGYGTVTLDKTSLRISVIEGRLAVRRLILDVGGRPLELSADAAAKPGRPANISIPKTATVKPGSGD